MLKNYLKTAIRNITRHKGYSFINLAGLAVGLAVCILILLWVQDELRYDRFHENGDRIYRALEHENLSNGNVLTYPLFPPAFGPALKNDYPEVLETVRFRTPRGRIVTVGDNSFYEDGLAFADPALLTVFSFPLIKGNSEKALLNPDSMVITETMAVKYFDTSDPMGKMVRVDNIHEFQVTGVCRDLPSYSQIRFDFIIPISNLEKYDWDMNGWNSFGIRTYVLLAERTDFCAFNSKIENFLTRYNEDNIMTVSLQPMKKVHLYSAGISSSNTNGNIKYVAIFSLIAFLILLMACVNFMNLTTARSENRAREVGLRKVVGAQRTELIFQFIGESMLLALFSLIIALTLVQTVLPYFNTLADKQLSFPLFSNGILILGILLTTLAAGLIAGSYPAFFLSAIQPVRAFSRNAARRGQSGRFRKLLVVSQFVLTIALIIGTIVIHQQMLFIRTSNLGFEKEHILCLSLKGDLAKKHQLLKDRILENAGVRGITAASDPPAGSLWSMSLNDWEGRKTDAVYLMNIVSADEDYLDVLGLTLTEGRFLFPEKGEDIVNLVINEAAVKAMGMTDPMGKRVREFRIIGVIKDFHYNSLHSHVGPFGMFHAPDEYDNLLVKIRPENISHTVAAIEKNWNEVAPGYPFEFRFLDETIGALYRNDRRMGSLINLATLLAVFIAGLGLFGMASFAAEQRTKEVGIRKILGASIPNVFILLSRESFLWVLTANLIAWPAAYFLMNKWLSTFAFHISINIMIFFIAGAGTLLIAIMTIGYQTLKAALADPVRSLRHE